MTKQVLFICLFASFANALLAKHLIGGEVTYECLGNNQYEFSIRVYRDCASGGACFDSDANCPNNSIPATVSIYEGTSLFAREITLSQPTISRVDPDLNNPCLLIPENVCVEVGTYSFIAVLPPSNRGYTVSYTRCCRNETISNINTPGDEGATYTTEITPAAQQVCNNSPVFKNFPPIVICSGERLVFDHSASDIDGDSLVYKSFIPFSGGGKLGLNANENAEDTFNGLAPNPEQAPPYPTVTFAPGFSATQPMQSDPDYNLDLTTGLLTVTPTNNGQYVVGILVEEYRDGELLSIVRRDFQFNVTTCEPLVFADIEKDVVVGVKDFVINACGRNEVDFVNKSYQRSNIVENFWEFSLQDTGFTRFNSWDLSLAFPDTGQYSGRLILNPGLSCDDTANITVNIFPAIQADFEFQDSLCEDQPIEFTNLSTSDAQGGIQVSDWNFNNEQNSLETSPSIRFMSAGQKSITLNVSDINECEDELTKPLSYFPVPSALDLGLSNLDSCAPVALPLNQFAEFYTDDYIFEWDFGNGETSTARVPNYSYTEAGTYTVQMSVTSPSNCSFISDASLPFRVVPNATAAFEADRIEAPSYEPNFFFDNNSENASNYLWNIGDEDFTDTNLSFTAPDTGSYQVELIAFNPSGCTDTTFQAIYVKPLAKVFLPNAFAPNGLNNSFKPKGLFRFLTTYKLVIFDRYGRQLFETEDVEEGWNGVYNNEVVQTGVYTYILQYSDASGENYVERGYATVIK